MQLLSWLCTLIQLVTYMRAETLTEYPLYGIVTHTDGIAGNDLKKIAQNFNSAQGGFNSDQCKAIHESNPDFKIVYYHNSGKIFPDDLIMAETDKTSILRYPFGTLKASLTSEYSDNQLEIQLLSHFSKIPVKKSTASGNYSKGCQDFVSWVRIDNEYMKITEVSGDTITVTRGFIGNVNKSNPIIAAHKQNAKVFAPSYNRDAPGVSNCTQITYQADIESQFAIDTLVNGTVDALTANGDGSWFDVFSSAPFKAVDGEGNKLDDSHAWDDDNNNYFTPCDNYTKAQQKRLTAIYNALQKHHGYNPHNVTIFANNMEGSYFDCNLGLLLKANPPSFPYPLNGYCQENYAMTESGSCDQSEIAWISSSSWQSHVNVLINASSGLDLAALPMIAAAGCKSPAIEQLSDEMYEQVMLFGYASFLIGVKSKDCNARFGIPPMRQPNGKGTRYAFVDDIFYYKIGNPTETKTKIDDYQIKNHQSYSRQFENGIVIVNPTTDTDSNIALPKAYIDPATNKTVNTITLKPHFGSILLNK